MYDHRKGTQYDRLGVSVFSQQNLHELTQKISQSIYLSHAESKLHFMLLDALADDAISMADFLCGTHEDRDHVDNVGL